MEGFTGYWLIGTAELPCFSITGTECIGSTTTSRKTAFYFSAEAKAILAVCPELRRLNLRALGEFVACGCTL